MSLESLANELLLDLFECLHSAELIRSFSNLNTRFDQLLHLHFQSNSLDFRSTSRQDFDFVCQGDLSFIVEHVTSIHLSDDDDTPELPTLFLAHALPSQQFPQLQSLTLHHVRSTRLIQQLLSRCPRLTRLALRHCNFDGDIDPIWRLTHLRSCYLNIPRVNDSRFPLPRASSPSLEHLTIDSDSFTMVEFIALVRCTPHLRSLNVRLEDRSHEKFTPLRCPLLKKLRLHFTGSLTVLGHLLDNLPNLLESTIEVNHLYIDGYVWERILPASLRQFRLLMSFDIDQAKNIEEEMHAILKSFRTPFWLDKRQWFVRCDSHFVHGHTRLYTLPYPSTEFYTRHGKLSSSTCRTTSNDHSYDRVRSLRWTRSLSSMQFVNLRNLELPFPFEDHFPKIVPRLDRLTTLELTSSADADETDQSLTDLRLLLDQATHLSSLTLDYLVLSRLALETLNNRFLRQLDLMTSDGHFYGSECLPLIQSLMNDRCQVLLMNLESRTIVPDLVETLTHLRALTFQCQDDEWDENRESTDMDDDLLPWLRSCLPSNCVVERDEIGMSIVRIWIR